MKTITAEQLYNILMSNTFFAWYDNEFADHVLGEKDAPSKREIIEAIESMFL
jgi:hypothetical protein